jgi:hypothetical protein
MSEIIPSLILVSYFSSSSCDGPSLFYLPCDFFKKAEKRKTLGPETTEDETGRAL